jgi:hypothetical protein
VDCVSPDSWIPAGSWRYANRPDDSFRERNDF